jgi:hypothetical protein
MAQKMRSNEGGGKGRQERKKDQFAKRAIDT